MGIKHITRSLHHIISLSLLVEKVQIFRITNGINIFHTVIYSQNMGLLILNGWLLSLNSIVTSFPLYRALHLGCKTSLLTSIPYFMYQFELVGHLFFFFLPSQLFFFFKRIFKPSALFFVFEAVFFSKYINSTGPNHKSEKHQKLCVLSVLVLTSNIHPSTHFSKPKWVFVVW